MNNIIIEEYIIGAENIEVRYYIDGELFGRTANVPVNEYEKWAEENNYMGLVGFGITINSFEGYENYWRDWAIEEHLTQYLTENPLYMTDVPLYCKLWYSLCTWCANAFGSPQIR